MYVCVCACVCVYLMNNVYLCHSGRGLVCGSVREGCTLRLSDTQTHTDSTQRDTHMALCLRIKTLFHWLRGWCDWSVLSGGGWGCSGHSHGWFCQAQDKSCTVGRSCLLQYPACLLVHPRWSRHQFQIFYRINSRRTRRVVTSRFPGNSLGGFHKVKLLNFPSAPLCSCFSNFHQSVEMKPWCQTISSSFRQSGNGTVSAQVTTNVAESECTCLIDWMDLLFDHFTLGLGCSEQLFSIS